MLRALDGANPLAFLAALGTLRLLTLETQAEIRMSWERLRGFWRPKLSGIHATEEELCEKLAECRCWAPSPLLCARLGKNINVSKDEFRSFMEEACNSATPRDRRLADFAAAFGSEVCEKEGKDRIAYTDFCFITGSGGQHFLTAMLALEKSVTSSDLYDALFGEWRPQAAKGRSMRWDPSDATEYAFQWASPSVKGASAVLGANRLAVEGLPLFPTAPSQDGLKTTGFRERRGLNEFTWPIWKHYAGWFSVRSLISWTELQRTMAPPKHGIKRDALLFMGIAEVYRAQRVRIGEGANFKVSFLPARSL